jgi:hypothetical protein
MISKEQANEDTKDTITTMKVVSKGKTVIKADNNHQSAQGENLVRKEVQMADKHRLPKPHQHSLGKKGIEDTITDYKGSLKR